MQYSETIINAYARHVLKGKDAILKYRIMTCSKWALRYLLLRIWHTCPPTASLPQRQTVFNTLSLVYFGFWYFINFSLSFTLSMKDFSVVQFKGISLVKRTT